LLAVSESTRRDAIRLLGIPAQKIHTTPNGVSSTFHPITDPQQRLACQRKYNLPDEFILFVGTIEPRKNLPVLLKAFQHLAGSTTASLVIAGHLGWMYEDVIQQIQALALRNRILLTGYISSEDLPIVYNLAKVFVYPSIYEGFGLPPLEAMACGTPVITTDISAMADYIGEAGILITPQAVSGRSAPVFTIDDLVLADAIRSVLDSPTLQQQLSRQGQSQAARFTWRNTALATIKVYELAGGSSPASTVS
jgi:glycosyltransferase involved in cell wall biosynthesis